jgi:ankyrin repeat protein
MDEKDKTSATTKTADAQAAADPQAAPDPQAELFKAVERGNASRVDALLAEHPELLPARNARGDSLLIAATYQGRLPVLDVLLKRGAEATLHEAAAAGLADRARAHLDARPADVAAYSHDGFTPLHLAAFFGHEELARLFLDRGADVNARSQNDTFAPSNTPLHAAAANRQVDVAALLLERGADINARDGRGFTPLALAANSKSDLLMLMLLERGARSD